MIHTLVPLASFLAYCALLLLTLCFGRGKASRRFAYFLMAGMTWSLASFVLRADFMNEYDIVWARLLCLGIPGAAICYFHFVQAFQNRRIGVMTYIGYGGLATLAGLAVLGYVPSSVSAHDGVIYMDRGPLLVPMAAFSFFYVAMAIISLLRHYRRLTSTLERTRAVYLLLGIAILTIFALSNLSDTLASYSIDHIGNVANSTLVGYAILRHRLLDISLVVRRGLAYSAITLSMSGLYFFALFFLQNLFQSWQFLNQLVAAATTAMVAAVFMEPVTRATQELVDRLFLGESYDYRRSLARFSSDMGNVLDLEALAQPLLHLTTKAVGATQATLLLPSNGNYVSQFACRSTTDEPVAGMKLDKANPVVAWLAREGRALSRDSMEITPEFKALWETERRDVDAASCELLCPLTNKGSLVGILALGKKERGTSYSGEDLDLLTSLANEVAVLLENAQRHTAVKVEAHVDGLTGLFNHRFFDEVVDEEIHRSARFGSVFSLVMFDLDLFKTYNDAYGHVAGDAALRDIAECIAASMRRADVAFRYGGDEFTVVLPGATSDEAFRVAERIRKSVESHMDNQGALLTISAGVASWPRDAVIGTDLIRAADAALLHAKQSGMNCTRRFSQVLAFPSGLSEGAGSTGTLSMVYALAATVDAKDHFTYGHSKKVSKYATAIGEALGLSERQLAVLRNSALLHDIGKIGISDAILRKPGPLTRHEFEQIRTHPDLAVTILRHVEYLADCLPAVLHHHEHLDGSGYPLGLEGKSIPLTARILSVADAYDAMTSERPYRAALSPQDAFDELARCAGRHFDPDIVEAFGGLKGSDTLWQPEAPEATRVVVPSIP